jgi:ankyrin repeat protein
MKWSKIKTHQSDLVLVTSSGDLVGLTNSNGHNLLHHAVQKRDPSMVHELLKLPFDVNEGKEGDRLIDMAAANKDENIMLQLLKANSMYPRDKSFMWKASEAIETFKSTSLDMHRFIRKNEQEQVMKILSKNSGLRHFFSTNNRSALDAALTFERFEIYKTLVEGFVTFGPDEKIDCGRDSKFQNRICDLNSELAHNMPNHHIHTEKNIL